MTPLYRSGKKGPCSPSLPKATKVVVPPLYSFRDERLEHVLLSTNHSSASTSTQQKQAVQSSLLGVSSAHILMNEPTVGDLDFEHLEDSAKNPLRDMLVICGVARRDILQMCTHERWGSLRNELSEIDDADSKSTILLTRARRLLEAGAITLLSRLVINLAPLPLSADSTWCDAVSCLYYVAYWSQNLPMTRSNNPYPPRDWSNLAIPLLISLGESSLFSDTQLPQGSKTKQGRLPAVRKEAAELIELLACDHLHHSSDLSDPTSVIPFAQIAIRTLLRLRIVLLKFQVFKATDSILPHSANLLSHCLDELLGNSTVETYAYIEGSETQDAVQYSLSRLGSSQLDGRIRDQAAEISALSAAWHIGKHRHSLLVAFQQQNSFMITSNPLCSGPCLPYQPDPSTHQHRSDIFDYHQKLIEFWSDVTRDALNFRVSKIAENAVTCGIIFKLEWFDIRFASQPLRQPVQYFKRHRRAVIQRVIKLMEKSVSKQLQQRLFVMHLISLRKLSHRSNPKAKPAMHLLVIALTLHLFSAPLVMKSIAPGSVRNGGYL
ncbi:hypothetical protein DL93DRAFT_2157181 [Clavulina sp. PMI_390]|nr:hypothetical protein DL93DRAFT_2157181 [Clavulina sp. PMI_390]